MNSTRCGTSLAIARRIASRTSGTRKRERHRLAAAQRRARPRAPARSAASDLALDVERDDRLRQTGQDRVEKRQLLHGGAAIDDRRQ